METLLPIIDQIYAAAAGEAPWDAPITALRDAVRATTSVLFATPRPERGMETLYGTSFDPADIEAYQLYYHRLDPWLLRLHPLLKTGRPPVRVVRGEDLVPQDVLRSLEFYNDFFRHVGLEWVVGAVGRIGDGGTFNLGFHRPRNQEGFDAGDLKILGATAPHLRRALQLREQLRSAPAALQTRVLDALPVAAIVLDPELAVLHANAPAIRLCGPDTAIQLARSGARPGGPAIMRLAGAAETARLSVLVRSVALNGSSGGAFRLAPGPEGRKFPIALLVSPLPSGLHPGPAAVGPGRSKGLALVMLRALGRTAPPPTLLQDLFGLTLAEAEVATGLAGGTRAEELAAQRSVSLATIRAQIRAVLEKTGTMNLREMEALLASLSPPGAAIAG
jgi:DNA-binding CsgD family transcriptional regulator